MSDEKTLKKNLGFTAALSTVMGTVIGSGVFFKAAPVAEATGSVSLSMLAWFLGGVITVCAGLTAAELAAAIPETGGMIQYVRRTYGEVPAFLLGWAETIILMPANVAAQAIVFGTQSTNLLGLSNKWLIPISLAITVFLALLNFLGAQVGGTIQSFTTLFKLIPIVLIIAVGLFSHHNVQVHLFPVTTSGNRGFFTALGNGLLATMFAYDGWIHVGNMAGELKNPKRDLPRAILFGLAGIMIVYLFINYVFLQAMPIHSIMGNDNTAGDVAGILFGNFGGKLVTIGILVSVFGALNGYTMTGMRVPYAMALQNELPFSSQLIKLTKSGVPYICGIIQTIIAGIMIFMGNFNQLTDMLIFVIWTFYTLIFIAVPILRKREPDMPRPYKALGYPVVPAIAILGGIFILVNTLLTQTMLAMIGLALTLIGLPVYYYVKGHAK